MHYLGFDLGASSGRAMLGTLEDGRLRLTEIHRFSNDPVMLFGRMVWDVPRLVHEMKRALNKASNAGVEISAMGIDTWGVDFGLLDARGHLTGLPVHYRDTRTRGVPERAFGTMPKDVLYEKTGLAFNEFNTLFQLLAMREEGDSALMHADRLLFMPDLLACALTGKAGTEYTAASTGQLLDAHTRDWSWDVIDAFGLDRKLFLPIEQPGTVRGTLLPDIARECGVGEIPVIAVAGHDTASAVAAVPTEDDGCAWISSGTWSLLGTQVDAPVCTPEAMRAGYTNEGGLEGKIRLLRNIMGLWILQECRREWARRGKDVSFAEMTAWAEAAEPFTAAIDVDDPVFMQPGDMPARVREAIAASGQRVPETRGALVRVVCESLARKYSQSLRELERDILHRPVTALNIVGGGAKNALLDQMTADATGKRVIAGPDEATVIGNVLVQAMAMGEVKDAQGIRDVVRASFETKVYEPGGER